MVESVCSTCGEGWDAYGVKNGDMLKWQAILFLAGAGCPRCRGVGPVPELPTLMEALSRAYEPESEPEPLPVWEKPAPTTYWTCAGCDVAVIENQDIGYHVEKGELIWFGGRAVHYLWGHKYRYFEYLENDAPDEKAPFEIDGKPYCRGCVATCATCDTPIFRRSELSGETYDAGTSFLPEGKYKDGDAVCVGCYEDLCAECGSEPEACTCDEEQETEDLGPEQEYPEEEEQCHK